jgi:hypothetical protein
MPSNDALPGLLKDREAAQAEVDEATQEIDGLNVKLRDAKAALADVNAKIAEALGIEPASKPRAAAGRTNHERVLDVLKSASGPMKRGQIAKELDAEPNSVGAALAYLKERGTAVQEGTKSAATWTAV